MASATCKLRRYGLPAYNLALETMLFSDFSKGSQRLGNAPGWVMRFHLAQVAVVTNVVADAVLIHITPLHGVSRDMRRHLEGFQNRTGIILPATQIVYLGHPRRLPKLVHE